MLKISIFDKIMRYLTILLLSLVLFSSCKVIRSNMMLKTPKDFTYDKLNDSLGAVDYRIANNDFIQYKVLTNNGYKLINLSGDISSSNFRTDLDVTVESDGTIKLPLLGRVKVAGLTIKEAERLVETRYDSLYVNPYVTMKVTNRRVIIFPGNGGQARVIPLTNNNTTVMEAIASAGGIVEDGKAYKVKLIRNIPTSGKPLVYLMDLSEISGVKDANSVVQTGDIIYVEPRYRPLVQLSREITPLLTIGTSLLLIYQLTRLIN